MHSDYIEGIKKYKIMLRLVTFPLSGTLSLIMTAVIVNNSDKVFCNMKSTWIFRYSLFPFHLMQFRSIKEHLIYNG